MNKEQGLWKRFKETAFWVAEKSTFITVPLGVLFAGETFLAKEFTKGLVLSTFVGIDLLMYKFFKNRREKQTQQTHASFRSESLRQDPIAQLQIDEVGRKRLEKQANRVAIEEVRLAA